MILPKIYMITTRKRQLKRSMMRRSKLEHWMIGPKVNTITACKRLLQKEHDEEVQSVEQVDDEVQSVEQVENEVQSVEQGDDESNQEKTSKQQTSTSNEESTDESVNSINTEQVNFKQMI